MARWAYIAVPIGAVLLVGGWWAADAVLAPPDPQLGPVVVVTPHDGAPGTSTPTPTPDTTTPAPDEATVVPPAPPPPAGDDDDDDDDDLDDDDD
ncbi:hypothetical protein QF046_000186 [Microbacterium sp. W4I4]|uniref:hypothetical protein n=1 Tax=Microbacterium sp. W4I4 TaxID=3042295 RepID=UPI002781A247|nr:hypothetical protein [Microbacterium sp. W4I4]MDQ0612545.1 hypothetical protein [Microbacterium sp. W4I4]